VEVPGDTNSPDIVGRTGEQMPQQTHDGLEDSRDREMSDAGPDQDSRGLPRHSADGAKADRS
jgi:hypothetical protein